MLFFSLPVESLRAARDAARHAHTRTHAGYRNLVSKEEREIQIARYKSAGGRLCAGCRVAVQGLEIRQVSPAAPLWRVQTKTKKNSRRKQKRKLPSFPRRKCRPVELFQRTLGVHLKFDDEQTDANVKSWNVQVLSLNKNQRTARIPLKLALDFERATRNWGRAVVVASSSWRVKCLTRALGHLDQPLCIQFWRYLDDFVAKKRGRR